MCRRERKKRERESRKAYHEARRRAIRGGIAIAGRSRIDNSFDARTFNLSFPHDISLSAPPFASPFSPHFHSVSSFYARERESTSGIRRRRHPRGPPRAQPSLEVPRGQTSSQKLRYVGRSTAAHPGHPLTRETHASLLNQRRNHPPTHPRLATILLSCSGAVLASVSHSRPARAQRCH